MLRRLRSRSGLAVLLSDWHPIVLYTFLYYQSGLLNRVVFPEFLDATFWKLDVAVFGDFPGFFLHRVLGGPAANEVFHFAYFCYYLMIPLVGLLLFVRDRRLFREFVFQLTALFCFCYAVYIFLPVEGPLQLRIEFFSGDGVFERVVNFLYAEGENPGAAFPSSHVAVALLVALWGGRQYRWLRWPLGTAFVLLCVATVYCAFHYGVDVIAGILLGLAAVALMNRGLPPGREGRRVGCVLPARTLQSGHCGRSPT